MTIRSCLILAASLQGLAPAVLAADETTPPPANTTPTASAAPAQDEDQKTDLEIRMDRMAKAYRKLKKQVADPTQNASSLNLLSVMQDAVKEAVDLTPAKTNDLPEDQKAQFIADYKAGLKGMQDLFAKLGDALTAGHSDDAVKIVAEIDALEKKDHKEFRKPKKD